ncbi:MAG TPA: Gfo/Idh/MocA family oxidoreductase [Vicinamibacterales bacterium]
MNTVRTAVVGVGHLGQHHARILSAMPGASLVAVVDIDHERAQRIASSCGAAAHADWRRVIGEVDAVSIAVPTTAHAEVALGCIEAGLSVLVEKPMASTLAEADAMVEAAARRGVLLGVGHTERFNPATAAALPLVSNPRFIEVHRLATFPERSLDIDVVFDLMIHDLDLLLTAVGSPVAGLEVVGVNVLTPKADIANARIRFESGCIANVTASRISRDRVRKARFFQRDAYVSIDFAAREAEMYRLVPGTGRPTIQGGRLEVSTEEPLYLELLDFVTAVREGRPPTVTGEAGRRALALASDVAEAMQTVAGLA